MRRWLSRLLARLAWWIAPKRESALRAAWSAWKTTRRETLVEGRIGSGRGWHIEHYSALAVAFEDAPDALDDAFRAEVVRLADEARFPVIVADVARRLRFVALHDSLRLRHRRMCGGRVDRWGKDVDVYEFRSSA